MPFLFRPAQAADAVRLAPLLRENDRRELVASHPSKNTRELLTEFVQRSDWAVALEGPCGMMALGGVARICPAASGACVWLLTGKAVEKYPKLFFSQAKIFLNQQLEIYSFLYNWVDERYLQARRFITRLGGTFTGKFIRQNGVKFLFFSFRRSPMGGMLYAAANPVSTAAKAFEKRKQTYRTYTEKANRTEQELSRLQQAYGQESSYLFRSAAEKNRALEEQARLALAQMQVKNAQNGLDHTSVSAELMEEKNKLKARLQSNQLEQQTNEALEQAGAAYRTKAQTLRAQKEAFKKAANQKNTIWKLGHRIFSWFQ